MGRRLLVLTGLLTVLLAGCQSLPPLQDDGEEYAPPKLDYRQPPPTSGGLFRPGLGGLVQDRRAVQVGDILTVVLEEATQSSKSADTRIGKSASVGVPVPRLFGRDYPDLESALGAERGFDGSARSTQRNTLIGSLAVTVHEVLPNGVLLVKGEKWLRLNQGDEYIRLTGLVRPEDIGRNNRVSSRDVANARISYAGRGALADSNASGWLSRFFLSPLFPL